MDAPLPEDALLGRYAMDADDAALPHYTDCFLLTVPGSVTLAEYVYAFYTAPLFRCERIVLKLIGRGSSDNDARQIAEGNADSFAAWRLEDRTATQLLMCDFQSRTRSWFMVSQQVDTTQLFFGSAVLAANEDGPPISYRILLRLHRLYSRLLLRGAKRRLTPC